MNGQLHPPSSLLILLSVLLLVPETATAQPAFPAGFGQGFVAHGSFQWTGPSLEKIVEYGLELQIARMDGEKEGTTVGSTREWYLQALKNAGWPIPKGFRIDRPNRFEGTFFRKQKGKLQVVLLSITMDEETCYVIAKAYPDAPLIIDFDRQKVPYWHLPPDFSDAFPVPPFAQIQEVRTKKQGDESLGIPLVDVGLLKGKIPGLSLREVRDWYLGRLREDHWNVPTFFTRDDDDLFQQAFIRTRHKSRQAVQLTIAQNEPGQPVLFRLRGQQATFSDANDKLRAEMEKKQEAAKAAADPAKQIVDVDPADPDIDFWELPRGWAAGFPIPPDLQYITAKLRIQNPLGTQWREAIVQGAFLEMGVPKVRDWILAATKKEGFKPAIIPDEDESDLFKTSFYRETAHFKQNVKIKIFVRPDGYTELDITAQEDSERGTSVGDVKELMEIPPK